MSDRLPADVHAKSRVVDDMPIKILNSAEGVRNYIPKKDFFKMMNKVFGQIADNLADHCGPFSRSALIASPSGGKYETNTFTKDGKTIVASMNFVSPIEEIIKDLLLYIGSRVDNKAKDGTTSSMYIASRFFDLISKHYNNQTVNSMKFSESYKAFNDELKKLMDDQVIKIDDLMDFVYPEKKKFTVLEYQRVVAAIAAFQALSSSNGNVELADAMYQIYLMSPPGTWDYITVHNTKYENTKNYSVDVDDFDYVIDCLIETQGLLNHDTFTEYLGEGDLLILPEAIPGGGTLADAFRIFLDNLMKDTTRTVPLTVLCRDMDATFITRIEKFNNSGAKFKIPVFVNQDRMVAMGISLDLMGASLAGGVAPFLSSYDTSGAITDKHVIRDTRIHFKNRKLHIDYQPHVEKDPTQIASKYYDNPTLCPQYTNFLKSLLEKVERLKNDVNQTQFKDEIAYYQRIISRMTFPRRPYLMIGGAAHDHAEAILVVEDVCGAINSSLTEGFICGSSQALFRAILNYKEDTPFITAAATAVAELIAITITGSKDILGRFDDIENPVEAFSVCSDLFTADITNVSFSEGVENVFGNKYTYMNLQEQNNGLFTKRDLIDQINNVVDDTKYIWSDMIKTTYPVLQPRAVFDQLFYRIGEVVIKLITTECVIVPGAVYVDKENKD